MLRSPATLDSACTRAPTHAVRACAYDALLIVIVRARRAVHGCALPAMQRGRCERLHCLRNVVLSQQRCLLCVHLRSRLRCSLVLRSHLQCRATRAACRALDLAPTNAFAARPTTIALQSAESQSAATLTHCSWWQSNRTSGTGAIGNCDCANGFADVGAPVCGALFSHAQLC